MKLFLKNDTEIQKSKENNLKVAYFDNKAYININSINEILENTFILDFINYTPHFQFQIFQLELSK